MKAMDIGPPNLIHLEPAECGQHMIARLLPIPSPGALLLSWQMLRFVPRPEFRNGGGRPLHDELCLRIFSPRHCRQNLESSCPSLLGGDLTVRSYQTNVVGRCGKVRALVRPPLFSGELRS